MGLSRTVKNMILATWSLSGGREAVRLSRTYNLPGDWQRIYFWHIRKTAGTSLNRAFIALGGEETVPTHQRMLRTLNKRIVSGNKVFVGHNRYLIQQGRYFYAFSHHPWHELVLPPNTHMIVCFRDPVKRVLSHYRMLVGLRREQATTQAAQREGGWATGSLTSFLEQVPKEHLLRQLYMFSRGYVLDEALERIARCAAILHTEDLADGVHRLAEELELPLRVRRERTSPTDVDIAAEEIERLREIMQPEYDLLDRVRTLREPHLAQADAAAGSSG